ncbi:MAG: GDSL-type esterase/lipase family protein [Cyanophyceae cyanobacterium]
MTVSTFPKSDRLDLFVTQPSQKIPYVAPQRNPKPKDRFRPKVNQPLKIIAIGDSIVYGYGDISGGGWVERLRRQWMHPNSSGNVLYNLGVRGDKVDQVAARLEMEFRGRGELRNQAPDRLILSVGTNDSPRVGRAQGKPMTLPCEFQGAMASLLETASRLCPVYFVGMVPVVPTQMPFMDCLYYSHADQFAYKEITRELCAQRHIPYLDVFDLWMGRGAHWLEHRMGPDGLHPNDAGYESLWQDVNGWEAIATLS